MCRSLKAYIHTVAKKCDNLSQKCDTVALFCDSVDRAYGRQPGAPTDLGLRSVKV